MLAGFVIYYVHLSVLAMLAFWGETCFWTTTQWIIDNTSDYYRKTLQGMNKQSWVVLKFGKHSKKKNVTPAQKAHYVQTHITVTASCVSAKSRTEMLTEDGSSYRSGCLINHSLDNLIICWQHLAVYTDPKMGLNERTGSWCVTWFLHQHQNCESTSCNTALLWQ